MGTGSPLLRGASWGASPRRRDFLGAARARGVGVGVDLFDAPLFFGIPKAAARQICAPLPLAAVCTLCARPALLLSATCSCGSFQSTL